MAAGRKGKGREGTGVGVRVRGERQRVPARMLRPNPWNPNEQADEIRAKVRASLERFGSVQEVLVREVGPDKPEGFGRAAEAGFEIVDGEHRWRQVAALADGGVEVDVRNLGTIADSEAKEMTVVMNELSGAPDPNKLAALLVDLDKRGQLAEAAAVFPYTAEEIDGLLRLPKVDQYFLQTGKDRIAGQGRASGVAFRIGPRNAMLSMELGVRLIKAYERAAARHGTGDPAVVARWIAERVAALAQAGRLGEVALRSVQEGRPSDGEGQA